MLGTISNSNSVSQKSFCWHDYVWKQVMSNAAASDISRMGSVGSTE